MITRLRTSEGGAVSGWLWVLIAIAAVLVVVGAVVVFTNADGDEEAASTTTTSQATTTTSEATTTTVEETTTTTEATSTTEPPSVTVPESAVVGVLQPYGDGSGSDLFPPGSVEAHWYQWEGFYIVLYRGFDAVAADPICPGNSIYLPDTEVFDFVTNSPYLGEADEICVGAPKIAELPAGVYACDALLYYVTEIPVDAEGVLFGTMEIVTADGASGQTSEALTDLAGTPEFLPDQAAYELAPSDVDDGGLVLCGS